jgi:hypothetical protein
MSQTYSDSSFAIRADLAAVHSTTMESFSVPGTWFDAKERREIVALSRRARAERGYEIQGYTDEVQDVGLPSGALKLIEMVSCEAEKIDKDFYLELVSNGLHAEQYVEIVGLVARAVSVDTFCRSLGLSMCLLGDARDGVPSKQLPDTATIDHAWVPIIPAGPKGGAPAQALYGETEFVANIFSALSLVPDEASGVMQLGQTQYVKARDFQNFKFFRDENFSRAQLELVAARISALNNCFY